MPSDRDAVEIDYIERSRAADGRLSTAYWDARFVAHVIREVVVETPGLLRDDLSSALRFVTGNAEPLGTGCRISECDRDAVAYLNGGRPYRTRRPLCERHYFAVKAGALGLIALLIVAFAASVAWLGVMFS